MGGYIGGNGGVTQVDGYNKTEVDSKVSDKVDHNQVLTDVPASAVFTDTTYSVQDGELSQNNFTDADHTKLDGIEAGATADQTDAEIKTAYENNSNTNAFTDADHSKLDGIETGATADQTKSDIDSLNVDADTLDGQHGSYYTTYADTAVSNLVDSSPATLNTLNELAAALGDDENFSTTMTNSLAGKVDDSQVLTNVPSGAVFTDTTYTVGDGGLTQKNFTTTLKTKLDGIESNAKDDQTITAGSGLSGGGTGNVTLSHADTSSVGNANNSGNTFIQDINFDTYGHVTSVGTGTVSVGNGTLTVQGTGALGGSGTFTANQSGNATISISHDDTSSQGSSNNSGRTYIQDVILDGYGHVTGLATATETVVNTDTTYSVGDNGLTQKNFTTTLKNKLDGIAASANNYSFPYTVSSSGSANTVVQRSSGGYIFANYMNISPNTVSNGSITKVVVESGNDGYTRHSDATAMRTFLNVANGANNYTHPSGNGNNHIPSGGSSGQVLQYSSAGTAAWATPSSPDPFPAAPTWTSPDTTYTSSGSWSKPSSIADSDWVIFHLISGGGSGNAGGSGQGGKGGALVMAVKGVSVPSSISFVIGAGGGYNGYGGFANAGQPSTITISGKTFTSGQGGGASYYTNSGGPGNGVLAWPGGSSPATIITVDDVRGGGSLGGGTSAAGNAGSGGYYGAGGNGALRIHY